MTTKLFVLGRPGSGKSTAVRYISEGLQGRKWGIHNFNDYPVLLDMAENGSSKVRLMVNGGVDVHADSAYDEALQTVKRQVEQIDREDQSLSNCLVTIEFSRDGYQSALQQFGNDFARDAYLLFIHADIETCRKRIYKRMKHPERSDDHPSVPEEIYEARFANDNLGHMEHLKQYRAFCEVEIISNMESLHTFHQKLGDFVRNTFVVEKTPVLVGHDLVTITA